MNSLLSILTGGRANIRIQQDWSGTSPTDLLYYCFRTERPEALSSVFFGCPARGGQNDMKSDVITPEII